MIASAGAQNLELSVRQNEPAYQRLLQARQWRWAIAVRWQVAQLCLVLTTPVMAMTLGLWRPETKPWISFLAVCLTLADVAWIDRAYRAALKTAARASELFDTRLLELDWNNVVAGRPPTPEETDRASRGWVARRGSAVIADWYSPKVDRVPTGIARAICQRTNLTYDSDLRRIYRIILDVVGLLIGVFAIAGGMFGSAVFSDFVLTSWVPSAPLLVWALRERFRQFDAVQSNDPIISEAEELINDAISTSCTDDECKARSRLLQDAIFYRRATTVLLFPGIYKLRRDNAESDMRAAASYWVDRALATHHGA